MLLSDVLMGRAAPYDNGAGSQNRAEAYDASFRRSGNSGYLDAAVEAWREALDRTPEDHPQRTPRLLGLANALLARADAAEQDGDLDSAVEIHAELLHRDDLTDHVSDPGAPWAVHASLLLRRWERDPAGHPGDLDEVIMVSREVLDRTPEEHPRRTSRLLVLADALLARADAAEQDGDLDSAVEIQAELVHRDDLADHVSDPGAPWAVHASLLLRRWERDPAGHPGDLDEVIMVSREVLDQTPEDHPQRTPRLIGLANALLARINAAEQDGDLDSAIEIQAELLHRDDLTDHVSDPGAPWAVHASLLLRRWERDPAGHPGDLDTAVQARREALNQTPEDHPQRTPRLIGLANALLARINAAEQDGDLDSAVEIQAELLHRDDLTDHVSDPGAPWAVHASLLLRRWERDPAGHPGDLDTAVQARREALNQTPEDHPQRTPRLIGLADALLARADGAEQDGDLDSAVEIQAELVHRDDLADYVDDPGGSWAVYASLLLRRWERDPAGHPGDLDEVIMVSREVLDRAPEDHPQRTPRLVGLADALLARADAAEQDGDLDSAVEIQAELVHRDDLADHVSDPGAPWAVHASLLLRRWERDPAGHPGDLDEVIMVSREVLDQTPEDHPQRTPRLIGLANALLARINAAEQDGDLDSAVEIQAELVHRDDLTDHVSDPGAPWAVHASLLLRRWERDPAGHPGDLDTAVQARREALNQTPEDHPQRTPRLIGLADALLARINAAEQDGDLDSAVEIQAELLHRDDLTDHLSDPGDPAKPRAAYASLLRRRWERDPAGHPGDLDTAVQARREALNQTPEDHPQRTPRLIGLADALLARINAAEQDGDLDSAVEIQAELLHRDDLTDHLSDPGDPAKPRAAYASLLRRRWERDPAGHPGDLDEVIMVSREVLDRTPEDHPQRTPRLIGLANALLARINAAEQDGDLDSAVEIQAELLRRDDLTDHLSDPGDPAKPWAAYASLLRRRWERDPAGHPGDLDTAVQAGREALNQTPEDHPQRTRRLLGLADALLARINAAEQDGDLDSAVEIQAELVHRDDLADLVRDPGAPWAVHASLLLRRWERDPAGHPGDLDTAVQAGREALNQTPEDHPQRTRRLLGLANALLARIDAAEQDGDLDSAVEIQAELLRRDDLADLVRDPGAPWAAYASLLRRRWERDPAGHPGDLDTAVQAGREALNQTPEDHPQRTRRLLGLANALLARIDAAEQDGDLDSAVEIQAELLRRDDLADLVRDPGAPWAAYASLLRRRWERDPAGHPGDLDTAVQAGREALNQTPEDHPQRTRRLLGLANALLARIDAAEQDGDLDSAVEIQAELVHRDDLADLVRDPGAPWAAYASLLLRRWERDPAGHPGDLDEVIMVSREVLDRTPEDHPQRTRRLLGLANALLARINAAEQDGDLDSALEIQAELLHRDDLTDHLSDPGGSWAAYASLLRRRWERDPAGHPGDLDTAVQAGREALNQTPEDHPQRTRRLIGLANALLARINAAEQDGDLDSAVEIQAELVHRDDLADHVSDPGGSWAAYASLLLRRRERRTGPREADSYIAVEAGREALNQTPEDHPQRTPRLVDLANALLERMNGTEQDGDLDSALEIQAELVHRDDLADLVRDPGGSWAAYASLLRRRWERDPAGHPGDLDTAVQARREALNQTPEDHPQRTRRRCEWANSHLLGYLNGSEIADLDRAISEAAGVLKTSHTSQHDSLLPALRRLGRLQS